MRLSHHLLSEVKPFIPGNVQVNKEFIEIQQHEMALHTRHEILLCRMEPSKSPAAPPQLPRRHWKDTIACWPTPMLGRKAFLFLCFRECRALHGVALHVMTDVMFFGYAPWYLCFLLFIVPWLPVYLSHFLILLWVRSCFTLPVSVFSLLSISASHQLHPQLLIVRSSRASGLKAVQHSRDVFSFSAWTWW